MTNRGFLGVAMLFGVGLSAVPAAAETLVCPDLSDARQVAACPTEAELRYTFVGYCSDNARMYDGKADACADFATYRKVTASGTWIEPRSGSNPDVIRWTSQSRGWSGLRAERGRMQVLVCRDADVCQAA